MTMVTLPTANASLDARIHPDPGFAYKMFSAGVIGLLVNALLLAVLMRRKQRGLTRHWYTMNLLVGDILLCSCAGPIRGLHALDLWAWSEVTCRVYVLLRYLPVYVAVNSLCLIAGERLVAVAWPTSFKWWSSSSVVRNQIVGIWLFTLIQMATILYYVKSDHQLCLVYKEPRLLWYVFASCVVMPTGFLATVYGAIVTMVWRRLWQRRKKLLSIGIENISRTTSMESGIVATNKRTLKSERVTHRLTLIAAGVTLLFLACWLPSFIPAFISNTSSSPLQTQWFDWTTMLIYLHATVNAVLLFLVDPVYRREWKQMLKTCRARKSSRCLRNNNKIEST